MSGSIFFKDNFFSAGITEIYNENQEQIGSLNLKSAFSSSVEILDRDGNVMIKGNFPFFSRGWSVKDKHDQEIGKLKQRLSFLSKKFVYQSYRSGDYIIRSEAFSKDYDILDQNESLVAEFRKISNFFQSSAYNLKNHSSNLSNEELIAVVMGVNMIQKQNSAAASNGAAGGS
ncbi:hypothetical protein NC661_04910 [Aquibacillus koreensis]|uniref:Uncharacterized protein n=1 Tax=Aquibacillus koreensis TaxID=279446 RepID=A0A9X3WH93_9BACI|nr:hypothetical protein [Aquibacillus koreensis]MCT2534685.1 hypothetical protein [Aquibacillus koreensis]MDC3419705.1 hypothetical protein [Aquibacillus koreensis]